MKHRDDDRVPRRRVLQGALAASASALFGTRMLDAALPQMPREPRLVERENRRAGALDWQLTRVRLDRTGGYRSPWIEGYASRQSVEVGESIRFMVSTDPPAEFVIELFRMGYYGERGARLMKTLGPFPGKKQPLPESGRRRRRECRWEAATELKIPPDWSSGVYLGRLSRIPADGVSDPWQSYVVFVVRDRRPADVLFQVSDNTWQAYNRWPDRFSLYDDGEREWWTGSGVDVSFDRPYGKYRQIYENPQSVGSGEFLCWEFPLCFWLERHGYDVTYCSNSDLLTPKRALECKTFISVGHDEYWDLRQYHSVKALIDGGVCALFLSGNSVCWVAPLTASGAGQANRVMTRAGPYAGLVKAGAELDRKFVTTGPDEGLLMGARNVEPVNGGGDWIAAQPDHWLFEGTGMQKGDRIPGLVGWEYHGNPAELPGLEVVAEGTALRGGVEPQRWTATVHPGPRGNFVFNAATIFWAQALSAPPGHMLPWSHWTRPHGPDARVERMTHNLLRRAGAGV